MKNRSVILVHLFRDSEKEEKIRTWLQKHGIKIDVEDLSEHKNVISFQFRMTKKLRRQMRKDLNLKLDSMHYCF